MAVQRAATSNVLPLTVLAAAKLPPAFEDFKLMDGQSKRILRAVQIAIQNAKPDPESHQILVKPEALTNLFSAFHFDCTIVDSKTLITLFFWKNRALAQLDRKAYQQELNYALLDACLGGHIEAVERFLGARADIKTEALTYRLYNLEIGLHGENALILASQSGHTDLVELLLKKGFPIDASDVYGNTALIRACENHNYETALTLIHSGANVNAKGSFGKRALLCVSPDRASSKEILDGPDNSKKELYLALLARNAVR